MKGIKIYKLIVCMALGFLKNPISLTNKELLIFSIQPPVSFCDERSQFLLVLTISLGRDSGQFRSYTESIRGKSKGFG